VAELSSTDRPPEEERPFPPGDYPLVVVGSGPGGIQLSYCLTRVGVPHAVISADPGPGGMFRRWPFFQRLLSWTKPYAPTDRQSRAFERYDWNSLLADEVENRAIMPTFMDGTSEFPSRAEMEMNIATFVERTGVRVRYDCRWTATRREGDRFVLETTDGEYHAPIVVMAIGISQPWRPPTPGLEGCAHYGDTRSPESYAGRRVFIIGKQVSAFELATGLLQWACQIVLASPSPAKLSVNTKSLVGIRARYVQPYEDHILGGGVSILDASIDRVDRTPEGAFIVRLSRTDGAADLAVEVDDIIAATGFQTPLLDLPELGVATTGQSRIPAQTPFWESASVPGLYFAGTITQGSTGLRKHGLPSNSGAVHGARYNARVLARYIAQAKFGWTPERPSIAPRDLAEFMLEVCSTSPELYHQRAYLAHTISVDPAEGIRDEGITPLTSWLDAPTGDGVALTIEADGSGVIYPVIYLRREGATEEIALEPHPLLDFRTADHRRRIEDVAARLVGAAAGH
jgi:thioredoxin reductase